MMSKRNNAGKGKLLGTFSGVSGSLSFLGGWQVCHNLCLGLIALLSLLGITIVGMPLLFLTQYAVYFWSMAALILMPTVVLYWRNRKCMSSKLILFNAGIVVFSAPFVQLPYQIGFWLVGGFLIAASIRTYVKNRFSL